MGPPTPQCASTRLVLQQRLDALRLADLLNLNLRVHRLLVGHAAGCRAAGARSKGDVGGRG